LIVSGGVFLVSLITGLLGGVLFFTALLRALVFAVVFFGIVAGIYSLYNKFLLPGEPAGGGPSALGRNVDYTVDDSDDWFDTWEGAGESLAPEDTPDAGIPLEQTDGTDAGGGALEQNGNKAYTDSEAPALEKPPADSAASAGYALDIDMSDFTPDAPMFSGADEGKAVLSGAAEWRAETGRGMVDMSVARKSDAKADLYSDADGKKMADAIKTLLKKDEG
jgi:hypothetical protein